MAAMKTPFLDVLYEPQDGDARVDVVFIHGLNPFNLQNYPYLAWTHTNGTCWPKDLFPKTYPDARILLFGYNSNVAFEVSKLSIHDHANELLDRLFYNRTSEKELQRPIVFIAHSLGGLVVKQALIDATLNSQLRSNIKDSTIGIVFFATPHRGGNGVSLGQVITNAVLWLSGEKASKNDILENLKPMSTHLDILTRNFRPMLERYRFISLFETKPMKRKGFGGRLVPGKFVVDRQSAVLGLSSIREHQIAVEADHSSICKFSGSDSTYQGVSERIVSMIRNGLISFQTPVDVTKDSPSDLSSGGQLTLPNTSSKMIGLPPNSEQVLSYPDFNTWLTQFSGPSEASSVTPVPVPMNDLSGIVPRESKRRSILKRISTGISRPSHHEHECLKMPTSKNDMVIKVLISGLRKETEPKGQKLHSVEVELGLKTRVDELILTLMAKGYCHIEGFYCKDTDIGRGTMVEIDEPISVQVVSSKSQYDIDSGPLLINENERFMDFYKAVIGCRPVHISLPPNESSSLATPAAECISVECGGVSISISLKRTLRVPEDGKVHNLPADLGSFPLFNSSQFQESLPEAMKAKGGLFFPMYQREAMWISFSFIRGGPNFRNVAIRLYMGGVNVISGEAEHQKAKNGVDIQDYVVIPGQEWLDGFRVDKETVRQFVAMPLGLGYSVEKQITGEEFIGGIQLEILQQRLPEIQFNGVDISTRYWRSRDAKHSPGSLESHQPSITPRDIGLKSGNNFDLPSEILDIVKYYHPKYRSNLREPKHCWYSTTVSKRASLIRDFLTPMHSGKGVLYLAAIHDPVSINITYKSTMAECGGSKELPSKFFEKGVTCSPFMLATDFYQRLIRDMEFHDMYLEATLFIGDKILDLKGTTSKSQSKGSKGRPTIFDLGITNSTPVSLVCPWKPVTEEESYYEGYGGQRMGSGYSPQGRGTSWEMAVAAGGLIKQEIFEDPDQPPYSRWDIASRRMFNIQIVNSVAFKSITGLQTPPTPISVQTYKHLGVPFFQHYEEKVMQDDVTTIRDKVESVGMIDDGLVEKGVIRLDKYIDPATAATGCTACLSFRKTHIANLCDRIVQPCNHAVCSSCYRVRNAKSEKYPWYKNQCPICSKLATATLEYSSPMGMPEAEKQLGFALQEVQLITC